MPKKSADPKKPRRVSIDAIIKRSSSGDPKKPGRRPPGRPKNPTPFDDSSETHSSGDPLLRDPSGLENDGGVRDPGSGPGEGGTPPPIPIDSTPEARAFLASPFEIVASATKEPRFALYPEQLDALTPSFKVVYDIYIRPKMGEHAPLYVFLVCFSGVLAEKFKVYKEYKVEVDANAKAQPPFKTSDGKSEVPTSSFQSPVQKMGV